ncbi:MAG TPA: hypothetical protein VEA80_04880 [Vitreimonas sp.]|uniref:hypothetical protein n=1 Tax=Vitreimonas sp. TaxID=3069702 RepID=UPI002D58AE6B|nr:hypothetical protein [Vitreimonas sp.]HYD86786.1 hypothetical protein [Vitreimonas sp.]
MPAASMTARLVALEGERVATTEPLVTFLTTELATAEELAQLEANAKAAWAANHGRPWPAAGRVMRILLCGLKPERSGDNAR